MYIKIAIFVVFVLVGFALMAGMLNVFIFLQEKIGNGEFPLIKGIKDNFWPVMIGVWIFMSFGLLIALPAMIKDGFFADEKTTTPSVTELSEKTPAGALPPLELQIKSSPLIIVARTQTNDTRVWYYVVDVLKDTASSSIKKDQSININTKTWELLGYVPTAYQEVVFFFTDDGIATMSPLEALVIQDGKVVYGKDDPTIKQELTIDELRNKVSK